MTAAVKEEHEAAEGERRKPKRSGPAVPAGTPAHLYPQRMNAPTAAQLLGVGRSTFDKWMADGVVPDSCFFRYSSRHIVYDRDALLAWRPSQAPRMPKKRAD